MDLLARATPLVPDPVLAAQRVVAETAMITSELPSTGTARTVVVVPPRRWDPPQAFLDQLVALASAGWTAPVSLPELAAADPPEVDRTGLHYPRAQRRGELPVSYVSALRAMQESTSDFADVLTDRTRLVPGLTSSLLRMESTWWRGRAEERGNRLNREKTYLAALRGSVRIQPGSFTFGSRSGKIPLTLVNELGQDVRVILRLSPQTSQLRLEPLLPQTIGANQKLQVEVDAVAVARGPVVVEASLRTLEGRPYGQPVQLRVDVTQIGTVALAITVAAAVVLFLAAGVRVVRRMRAARRSPVDTVAADEPA